MKLLRSFLLPTCLLALLLGGCDVFGPEGDDDPTVPSAPTGLQATAQDGAVELSWEPVSDADTYNVYRSTSETGGAEETPLETGLSESQHTDQTAANGTVYYYRVTAVADTAESSASGEVNAKTPPASPGGGEEDAWTRVKSGTDQTIHDVALTTEGAFAVAEGGILLRREESSWTKVLDGGPSGNGNNLFGLEVTSDSTHLWLVGASGAIGEYDVTAGSLTDRSAPMDVTNNFNGVSAEGEAGSANVYVVGASGKVYYSFDNGASGTWNSVTPGDGAALLAVDFYQGRKGHLVDGNQTVFETEDGETWTKTGIADADVGFRGVDADGADEVWVSGGSGMVFQWNGAEWTPSEQLGDAGLEDIGVDTEAQRGYAVGGDGAIFRFDGTEWAREETPTGQNLNAVVQGDLEVAVGDGGTILER